MPDHAEISALCRSVLEGCIMPENYASIWTKPQDPVLVRRVLSLPVRFGSYSLTCYYGNLVPYVRRFDIVLENSTS